MNPAGGWTRPPPSVANVIILAVTAALVVTAAASTVFGGGANEATPHGLLLAELEQVASAQDRHHADHGRFAAWVERLDLDTDIQVDVTVIHADARSWEAVARHGTIDLSCVQEAAREGGKTTLERPVCFTAEP